MKITFLLVFCAAFIACGTAKAPSGEQIQAALDSKVKKGNPNATAKLTDIVMGKNGKATNFKFTCTDCLLEDGTRTKKTSPSAKGRGTVWLDPQDGAWKFDIVTVYNADGTEDVLSFADHKF